MGKIIIKCFETPRRKYFYDRHRNSVVAVNEREYQNLKEIEKTGVLPQNKVLERFTKNGLLQETHLEEIEHPDTESIKYLSQHGLNDLILQVTQQCNLRCNYCVYSGNYYNRTHTAQRMDFELAKKAIDFYLLRSDEAPNLTLSFYGGEPLLEFDLIKKCVDYISKKKGEQTVKFPMTTNGTLLTEEKFEFLINNNFNIMISLDGTKESHDANRKFLSGEGSFDLVIKNLKLLKKYNETYYKEHVLINCVISATTNLNETYDFFCDSELFYPNSINFNFVDLVDIKDPSISEIKPQNQQIKDFEYLKMLLCLINRKEWDTKSTILRRSADNIELLYEQLHRHAIEARKMHHSGPCIPGIRRLFVTVNGDFFPCERVPESNSLMSIGSLKSGFDYKKMDFFLNNGKLIEKECLECWNLVECNYCLGSVEKHDQNVTGELLLEKCNSSKLSTESSLQQVCVLAELGYTGYNNLNIFR